MDMRKKDMRAGIERFQQECSSTVELLQTILAKQNNAMEKIEKMTNKEIVKNNKYFIDMSNRQFQYLQKIITLNMELEELTFDEHTDADEDVDFRVSTVSLSETIFTGNRTEPEVNKIPSPTIENNFSKSPNLVDALVPSDVEKSHGSISDVGESRSVSEVEEIHSMVSETEVAHSTPVVVEEPKTCEHNIIHKLQGHTSRIERVRKALPVPFMPDLTFRAPSVSSSSEYFSAPEKSISSKNKKKKHPKSPKGSGKIEIKEPEGPKINELCFITSFVSPSEFYINIVNDSVNVLNSLDLETTSDTREKEPFSSKAEAARAIKRICLAYSSEYETWYRAQVIDWLTNVPYTTDNVYIQFLDYGDYKVVNFKELQTIESKHCKHPKFAIRCNFAHLFPKGMVWAADVQSYFNEIMNAGTHFKLIHVDSEKAETYGVELIDVNEVNEENTIGQHLINAGLAVEELFQHNEVIKNSFMKEQVKTAQGMDGIHVNMTDQEVLDRYYENLATAEEKTLEQAATGYTARDEARRCPFSRPDGTCFKGRSCPLEHFELRKDGCTTDNLHIFTSALHDLPVPKVDDELKIFITTVNGVNNFYATIRNYDPNGRQLKAMVEEINRPETIKKLKPFDILPAVGEIVIAKHWDGRWYRARVLDIDTVVDKLDNVIKVYFVDFGETLHVEFKEIKQIEERHLDFPFQAIRCSIHNIKVDECKPDGKDYFESRYLCNTFSAVVKYVGFEFISIILSDSEKMDIGQTLIDNGFAVANDTCNYPTENQLLID